MTTEPTLLDHLPLWAFFLAVFAVTLAAGEIGYRLGRRLSSGVDSEKRNAVGSIVGSLYGLLAFLLAFTFGLAASRYDNRRELHQEEVNAIRTTYMRSEFLPEPHGSKVRELLRKYVDVQVRANSQDISIADAVGQSEKLQKEIWRHCVEVFRNLDKPGAPDGNVFSLLPESQGEIIATQGKRLNAVTRTRVPAAVWAGLLLLTILSNLVGGYHIGLSGISRPLVGIVMVFCLSFTLYLTADLDRPLEGLIRVDHGSMTALRASMTDEAP